MKELLNLLISGKDLTRDQAAAAMNTIMSGEATPAQVAGFLIALRIKGETVDEITGCARVMREKATRVQTPAGAMVIDTCGTGGDHAGTFNISTAAAIVAAACGLTVAKHGNRSVTSSSGSADVLKTLGVNIEADVPTVERCLAKAGIGFLFAPLLHGAMKHAVGPRRELGVRTIFNVLGPLTNPAGARRQVMGVFDVELVEPLAHVLLNLGAERALVVAGGDGLDEISLAGPSRVAEATPGGVKVYEVTPEDFGLDPCAVDELKVDGPEASADVIRKILDGEPGAPRRVVLANAAAALMAGEAASDLKDAVSRAAKAIDSGRARETLAKLVAVSGGQ